MLRQGADIHKADNDGNTPLHGAARRGHVDIVRWLVEAGADIHKANNNGNSPLDGVQEESVLLHIVRKINWCQRSKLAMLVAALKQHWQALDAEALQQEARQQQHTMHSRIFFGSLRLHRHVLSFTGVRK